MLIQLKFKDPASISARIVRLKILNLNQSDEDTLSLKFLKSEHFLRADDGKPIPENHTIREKIPMQVIFTKGMVIMEKASE